METQHSHWQFELPEGIKKTVEIIERRVKASSAFHLYPVYTWNQSKTSLVSLDTISGEIAISIIGRVIERSLHSGMLMFQGLAYDYLHSRAMTKSVEHSLLATHGHKTFFAHDLGTLIEQMLRLFLKHQHLVVRGNARTLRIPTQTIPRNTTYAYTSTTLH